MGYGFSRRIADWLGIIRIGNVIVIGLSGIAGYIVGSQGLAFDVDVRVLVLVALVPSLIGAGGNIVNDYFDRFIDAVNKPWRPIPSGRIRAETALKVSLALMVAGVFLSIALNLYCVLTAILASVLLFEYSRWLKKTGLPGNLVIAFLSFLSIFFGGLASPNPMASLLPGLYAFLIILGRELLKGIEDLEGDRRYGVRTLAVIAGPRAALLAGTLLLVLVIAISPLPYMLYNYNIYYLVTAVLGVDAPIIASIILVASNYANAWKATRILKIPLLMGLLAFLLGVF